MSCLLTGGILASCDDLQKVGGVNKTFYAISKDYITSYTESNGFVTEFTLSSVYASWYTFTSRKRAHVASDELVVQAGANSLFRHTFIAKVVNSNPSDDGIIEILKNTDVVIVYKTNNNEWFAMGIDNGLELTAQTQTTGTEGATDVSTTLTFTGEEKKKPRRLNLTGGNQTYFDANAE